MMMFLVDVALAVGSQNALRLPEIRTPLCAKPSKAGMMRI